MTRSPIRRTPMPARKKRINARSKKRDALYRDKYLPQRLVFLAAHPYCEMQVPNVCMKLSSEIQHKIQRSLDPSEANLLNEENWLASCHAANSWASDHPREAIEKGVAVR